MGPVDPACRRCADGAPLADAMHAARTLRDWLAALAALAGASAHHPCYRDCTNATASMVCEYSFVEEMYNTVNSACGNCSLGEAGDCSNRECVPADGVERTVFAINRMVPGPAIHVCEGDVLQVDLHVRLHGHADALHWHGLHQRATPHMDGVSMVTQCPVLAGASFRYRFQVDKAGTYFYHSHNGLHKVNGVVGALVARPQCDPQAGLYDADLAEHTVMLMDWLHADAEAVFPGLEHVVKGQHAKSVLINGRGDFRRPDGTWTRTPHAQFRVRRGLRYRFRLVNSGGLSCPLAIRVLGHRMTVIASDSRDLQPVTVDTLYTFSGERYDVVLEAGRDVRDGAAFWLHCYTGGSCYPDPVDQVAVLRYDDGDDPDALPAEPRPSVHQPAPEGVVMNSPYCGDGADQLCVCDMESVPALDDARLHGLAEPELTSVQEVQFQRYADDELYQSDMYPPFLWFDMNVVGTMNNVSYLTPAAPLLTQPGEAPTCSGCAERRCVCTHVVRVPLGAVLEVVLVDSTDLAPAVLPIDAMLTHPMHIHGYSFRVLAVGSLTNISTGAERRRFVVDNAARLRAAAASHSPPLKDTVMLPRAGYAIIRFRADNPGVWFFHCHYQYHMAVGMEMAFQVGDAEDFVKAPKDFPRCGNYLPD